MTTKMLPARINLQIREGTQNTLTQFDVEVGASRPREDGHVDHDVDITSIIIGLSMALNQQIEDYLHKTTVPDEARRWLASMRDWTFKEAA